PGLWKKLLRSMALRARFSAESRSPPLAPAPWYADQRARVRPGWRSWSAYLMKNEMTMYTRILAGLALAVTSCPLVPGDAAPPLVRESPWTRTDVWLQVQREGNAGARQRVQTATPAERELIMQRLLDRYSHPIPEYSGEHGGGSFDG